MINELQKIIIIIIVLLISAALAFVVWAFLWPSQSADLQKADITRRDYDQSVADIQKVIDADTANSDIRQECRPILKTHGQKTAKAVMLLHGVNDCPAGVADLANWFYEAGYNVYVPRAPHHGFSDNKQHAQVRAKELVESMSDNAGLVSGLGNELGLIGHSGGGSLSTWLAQYSDGLFKRVLLLAPYYEPGANQAPKWQLPLMRNIYGNHLTSDQFVEDNLSYWALANYLIIKQNYRTDLKASGLKHVGVIVAEKDDLIDNALARSIPEAMASASDASFVHETIPASMGVNHDMLTGEIVAQNRQELFTLYQKVYENE